MPRNVLTQNVTNDKVYNKNGGGDMVFNRPRIAEKLRDLRGRRTIKEVSNACGISPSTLSMYENGERVPRDEVKTRLAKFYSVSVESIFFD